MNHVSLRCLAVLLLLGLGLFWQRPARADVRCTASIVSISFGTVDPLNSQTDSTATLNYSCTSYGAFPFPTAPVYARVCFSIGEPGGASDNPRVMQKAGGGDLQFQFYQDAARSVVWGNQFGGSYSSSPKAIAFYFGGSPFPGGSGGTQSGTATLYGRVLGGQTTTPPGAYGRNYTANETKITVAEAAFDYPASCASTSSSNFGAFTASATVSKDCTVAANTLNFGNNIGLLGSAVNATTTIDVQCTAGTGYQVGVNAGQNAGGNLNARKLVAAGNNITYQLYRDPARTQVWGTLLGSQTVSATGNGLVQNLTVYGAVPAQATPPPGTYTDTSVVTVTY